MSDPSTDTIKKLGTTGILKAVLGEDLAENLMIQTTARKYFEKSSPTTQCEQGGAGRVIPYKPGTKGFHKGSLQTCTKCYICGLPILELGKKATGMFPECEHVLPIIAAAIYLKLYSNKDKGKPSEKLQLEYKWAHHICNQEKLDYWPLYIKHALRGGGKMSQDLRRPSAPPSRFREVNEPVSVKSKGFTIRRKPSKVSKSQSKKGTNRFTLKIGKSQSRKGSVMMGKQPAQIEYTDGIYDLRRILTEEIEPLNPPRGAPVGDLMSVSKKDIVFLLEKIWETTRQRSAYFKNQLAKIFGTKENFIRCRLNHITNIYQEIADHINSVTIGGNSLANLITLAGLSQLDPKMYRPEQDMDLGAIIRNPAKVKAEAKVSAPILTAAEALVDFKDRPVEMSPARPLSRSASLESAAGHAPDLMALRRSISMPSRGRLDTLHEEGSQNI